MPEAQVFSEGNAIVESIMLSPLPMVISNPLLPDNPLTAVNKAFCTLTGYPENEIIGRNCRFLAGPETEPAAQRVLREAIHNRRPVLTEILNYRRDGSCFRNGVTIAPIFDAGGELALFVGSQLDLGAAESGLAHRRQSSELLVAGLSSRQREVLGAMTRGLQNKNIARALNISIKTVEAHRAVLLQRLGVDTSAEAIRIAVEAGL